MLYPISNTFREIFNVDPFWKFAIDPEKSGEGQLWQNDFESGIEIAVPGSWNEQLEESGLLHYVGLAWYSKKIFIPEHFAGKRIWVRLGSADFSSKVWVNGAVVGEGPFGFLPVECEITEFVRCGADNLFVISVSNELNDASIPQGITSEHYTAENRLREETNPPARFDFSPFGGINRPVVIYTTPLNFIEKVAVTTRVELPGTGRVRIAAHSGLRKAGISAEITDKSGIVVAASGLKDIGTPTELEIVNCRFWSNNLPYLYNLRIRLYENGKTCDEYSMDIGVREVTVEGDRLLLNGEEIFLRGFGKHEDFPVAGRGFFPPLTVKDFALMQWTNSNSFRTSHYPYSEEVLSYADRKGMLVISEAPAVSLDLRHATQQLLDNHKLFIEKMVERDRNHPSVIIWSVGNEPNIVGDEGYYNGSGRNYWKDVFSFTRGLDPSRPITVPNCSRAGVDDPVFEFSDILSINRYYGWYEYPGNVRLAIEKLSSEMEELHSKYQKPILVTEFGADSLSGSHSTSMQMFTEEYQSALIEAYIKCIESIPYTVGEMVWNFADFRTPQHFRRVVLNLKGVFTRNREPKLSAYKLKEMWGKGRKQP